jgi:Zn finger protein HypA/HybF involved in hydrogenase expression
VFQEGSILLPTYSTARALSILATQLGAISVSIGEMQTTSMTMTDADAAVMQRIQSTLGKRGRPEASQDWAVTCYDCLTTTEASGRNPVNCPVCGSFHIKARSGYKMVTTDPGKTIGHGWKNTRFIGGFWEQPNIDPASESKIEPKFESFDLDETQRIQTLEKSSLYKQVEKLVNVGAFPRIIAFRLLDAGFAVLAQDQTVRQANRLKAIAKHFENGGSQKNVSLAVDPKDVDLFDVQTILPRLNPIKYV